LFLHRHHSNLVKVELSPALERVEQYAAPLSYHGWCAVLAALFIGVFIVWRAAKMLEAKEYIKDV
jgi:hypothetical protein